MCVREKRVSNLGEFELRGLLRQPARQPHLILFQLATLLQGLGLKVLCSLFRGFVFSGEGPVFGVTGPGFTA